MVYLVTYIPILTTAFLKRRTNRRVRLKEGRRDAKKCTIYGYYITSPTNVLRHTTTTTRREPSAVRGGRFYYLVHNTARSCLSPSFPRATRSRHQRRVHGKARARWHARARVCSSASPRNRRPRNFDPLRRGRRRARPRSRRGAPRRRGSSPSRRRRRRIEARARAHR